MPPKCAWEDEGDDLPETPTWRPLSPEPMECEAPRAETLSPDGPTPMECDGSRAELPPLPPVPRIPAFGIWRDADPKLSKHIGKG